MIVLVRRSLGWFPLFALLLLVCVAKASAADVVLAWDPNSEPDLAGYKIYYGSASGTYSTVVPIGTQTTYTVSGLAPGTYYFAVTAFNSSGLESGYSNEVSTTVSGTSGAGGCDLNSDGAVNALDLQVLINVIMGTQSLAGKGDFNLDGNVDALDLQILTMVVLGLRACPV